MTAFKYDLTATLKSLVPFLQPNSMLAFKSEFTEKADPEKHEKTFL